MKPLRILLVEDEALLAALMAEVLMDMGHTVCAIATTEAAAVQAAAEFTPDLMLVDSHLRQGSGLNAVATILKVGFVPHILMSGDRVPGDPRHRRRVVLEKPFSDEDLARAIERVIDPDQ